MAVLARRIRGKYRVAIQKNRLSARIIFVDWKSIYVMMAPMPPEGKNWPLDSYREYLRSLVRLRIKASPKGALW